MNIFHYFKKKIAIIIQDTFAISDVVFTVELPRNAGHGDLACNVAMLLKKQLPDLTPTTIAAQIINVLQNDADVAAVNIAGGGFINITIVEELWHKALLDILERPDNCGVVNIGQGEKVNIEYVSANPTGPMHVGHMRQAVFGDALSKLLSMVGFAVTTEFYINDAGGQINNVVLTVEERYKQALGLPFAIREGMYPGDYLIPVGEELVRIYNDALLQQEEKERRQIIRNTTLDMMLQAIKEDLHSLGVEHQIFTSELSIYPNINATLEFLTGKGLLYQGVLEPPKGKVPEDYEPKEQTLFRATLFGDEVDRPVKKSNGDYAYFAPDIAYHQDKIRRGFNEMVLVLGADHSGYIKRLTAAVKALSDHQANLDIKIIQMVSLWKNGELVRMSKRSGSYVTLREVVDEVGKDVVRFVMLTRKNDSALEFDFDKVVEQSKDNPVFYVQYAYARISSLLEQGRELGIAPHKQHISLLQHNLDKQLVRMLCQFAKTVEAAALAHEPHRIVYYMIELANLFHSYWAMGSGDKTLRFLQQDNLALSSGRLALAIAVQNVLRLAMSIIGVTPMERM